MIQFRQQYVKIAPCSIDMLPLVDIIFNLLIFFLITATISTKGINLDLPEAESAKAVPVKNQEIVINQKSQIFFNEVPISLKRLEKILENQMDSSKYKKEELVIVKAHKAVPFGLFVSIMDMARKTGHANLIIATIPKSDIK